MPPLYVGIDLGGTNVKAGVVDDAGHVLADVHVPTEAAQGPEAGIRRMCAAARDAVAKSGHAWSEVTSVGIGSPGTMDIPAGIIINPHNLPGWRDVPLRTRIAEELQRPAILQNDANAAAYGEYWVGVGRDAHSMVLFTLGTGIGCGVIVGDRIIEGEHSHGAEAGHVVIQMQGGRQCGCGQSGCLEAYASATALIKRTQEAIDAGRTSAVTDRLAAGNPLTPRLLGRLACEGDRLAEQLIMETARYLGVGVVNLMHTIDPDLIVLGGAMTFGRDDDPLGRRFREEVHREVRRRAFPVPAAKTRIAYATLGGDAGFIGAAGCARLASAAGRKRQAAD